MSFRSRSRTVQPVQIRPRSHSSSRVGTTIPSTTYSSPVSSYSTRPITAASSSQFYSTPSNIPIYQNSYNSYGSRESIYSPKTTRNSFFTNSFNGGRDTSTYGGSAASLNGMKYISNGSKYGGSNTSIYSPYTTDRYVSPYTSYDNGITTGSLNFSSYNPKKSPTKSANSYTKSININNNNNNNGNNNNGAAGSNIRNNHRDYNKTNKNSNLLSSNGLSGSNPNLTNSYIPTSKTTNINKNSNSALGRSQSLRDQERRSRNRNRSGSTANNNNVKRSLSVSSEKSEGYESGSEFSTRSRLGSTNSLNDRNDDTSGPDSAENGEFLDYKALWEASKIENDKLKIQLKKKDDEIHTSKATLDRFTNATTKNSLSEIEKRERRAMERKMSEMEEELKLLHKYKTENERLRAENRALTRVVSKLTISAQNQLHKKQ